MKQSIQNARLPTLFILAGCFSYFHQHEKPEFQRAKWVISIWRSSFKTQHCLFQFSTTTFLCILLPRSTQHSFLLKAKTYTLPSTLHMYWNFERERVCVCVCVWERERNGIGEGETKLSGDYQMQRYVIVRIHRRRPRRHALDLQEFLSLLHARRHWSGQFA